MSNPAQFRSGFAQRLWLGILASVCLIPAARAQVISSSASCNTCNSCGTGHGGGKEKCPRPTKFCYEGGPRLRFKRGCPRPVCDPCNLPHYGYFQTCWRKFPFPPDWSHCPCPPPGAKVPASQGRAPVMPEPPEPLEVQQPKKDKKDEKAPKPRPLTYGKPQPWPMGGEEASSAPIVVTKLEEKTAKPTGMRVVGSRRVILNVSEQMVGNIIPGKTKVELWYTQDGRQWHRDEMIAKSRPPFEIEVQQDGTYGFTVRTDTPKGRQIPAPTAGSAPQLWVEIDTQQPHVQMLEVRPVATQYSRSVLVRWTATDRNMAKQPVNLAWATSPTGPWNAVMTNLDNTGQATWQLPANVPPRFHLRVEAHDMAGNVGTGQATSPVVMPVISSVSTR